jgi:hypothetical protein
MNFLVANVVKQDGIVESATFGFGEEMMARGIDGAEFALTDGTVFGRHNNGCFLIKSGG